jgi:hypothetical protein
LVVEMDAYDGDLEMWATSVPVGFDGGSQPYADPNDANSISEVSTLTVDGTYFSDACGCSGSYSTSSVTALLWRATNAVAASY